MIKKTCSNFIFFFIAWPTHAPFFLQSHKNLRYLPKKGGQRPIFFRSNCWGFTKIAKDAEAIDIGNSWSSGCRSRVVGMSMAFSPSTSFIGQHLIFAVELSQQLVVGECWWLSLIHAACMTNLGTPGIMQPSTLTSIHHEESGHGRPAVSNILLAKGFSRLVEIWHPKITEICSLWW